MATKLSDDEVTEALGALRGWSREGNAIVKEFRFSGFDDSIGFVVRLGIRAEAADHHPDIDVRYNRVRVALSTHSEGGITDKDIALASEADAIVGT